jgi:phospholipase C
VSSIVFDHTSIIKTILLRFCRSASGSIPNMGARVAAANHLGFLLTEPAPRPFASRAVLAEQVTRLRTQLGSLQREPVPVGVRRAPNEFQREVAAAKSALAAEGQLPGMP